MRPSVVLALLARDLRWGRPVGRRSRGRERDKPVWCLRPEIDPRAVTQPSERSDSTLMTLADILVC